MNFKCSVCNGKGHTDRLSEQWAKSRKKKIVFKPLFDIKFLKTKTCDYCIGTGIDLNRMSTSILIKSGW